ncbi:hypothetical protein GCM10009760_02260 [Kitasatospora kazusensis]|uniref:Peptidase S1 domain-containing protein n=1 Tax=Kitasatospora kazusensis TaxID=407974 RepID=A0ABP5KG31_9ACTN
MFGNAPRTAWKTGILATAVTAGVLTAGAGTPATALGGDPAPAGSYAFTAKLDIGGQRSCSGALVDPYWVITAASCFAADPAKPLALAAGAPALKTTATIGRTDLTGTAGHVVGIAELVPRADRDLVMARLATPVTDVTPLALTGTAPAQDDALLVAGYGRTRTEWVPSLLHTATFAVQKVTATGIAIAAKAPADATVCKGDTGGPAVRQVAGRPALAGVNSLSWQNGCLGSTETRSGAVETRTDDITDWIQQTRALATNWKAEVVVKSDNSLYQAIRLADGSWTSFGNVETSAGGIGGVRNAAVAGMNGDTHVVALGGDGRLHHTIRRANGSWLGFGDLNTAAGELSNITQVSAVSSGWELQVVVVANGHLYHTVRQANGVWTKFGDVTAAAGPIGAVSSVATASTAGQLQVIAVSNGKAYHTVRDTAGSWSGWGDVAAAAGSTGPISSVAMAGVGPDVQIVVATDNGTHQYHSIRYADRTWASFGNLGGYLGGITARTVSAAGVDGELQLAVTTSDNRVLHIIRHADRTWTATTPVDLRGVSGTPNGAAITGTY